MIVWQTAFFPGSTGNFPVSYFKLRMFSASRFNQLLHLLHLRVNAAPYGIGGWGYVYIRLYATAIFSAAGVIYNAVYRQYYFNMAVR